MYFKETQQDQASYPYATYRSSSRTPILPEGYYGDDVMMGADGSVMETIKGYFTNKWVMLIAALLIIGLLMFFLMKKSSSVESYHY
jgi:hypothetical protein